MLSERLCSRNSIFFQLGQGVAHHLAFINGLSEDGRDLGKAPIRERSRVANGAQHAGKLLARFNACSKCHSSRVRSLGRGERRALNRVRHVINQ